MKGSRIHEFDINLLHSKKLSFTEKLIYFALHYLRYIIVITQISVITVFFYRFKIDQDIIDLKEKVMQKQEIMKITSPLVDQAVILEGKLNHIRNLISEQDTYIQPFDYVLAHIPDNVSLTSIGLSQTTITIQAQTVQIGLIKSIYNNFLSSKQFKSVVIEGINRDTETNIYSFSMILELI